MPLGIKLPKLATANTRALSNNNLRLGNFPNSFTEADKKLSVAIRDNNLPVVMDMLEEGADLTKKHGGLTPLMYASTLCRSEIVRQLLQKSDVNAVDRDGKNSLMLASDNESREGDIDTVRLLLDAGADVNAADNDGHNALWYARFNDNNDVANLLLEHGAVEKSNKSRKSRKSRRATRKSRRATRKSRRATRKASRKNKSRKSRKN
jgi:ankyrin repeat protein